MTIDDILEQAWNLGLTATVETITFRETSLEAGMTLDELKCVVLQDCDVCDETLDNMFIALRDGVAIIATVETDTNWECLPPGECILSEWIPLARCETADEVEASLEGLCGQHRDSPHGRRDRA